MPDAQFPTDGDDGDGNQPRRAGLRLRDAEAVATTRRDMFGDGSLLDTLAGSPPAPADSQAQPDAPPPEPSNGLPPAETEATEPTQAAEPTEAAGPIEAAEPTEAAEPIEAAEPTEAAGPIEAAEHTAEAERAEGAEQRDPKPDSPHFPNPASSPFAQVPESLDSIIDSFVAEPASQDGDHPRPTPETGGDLPAPQLDPVDSGPAHDGQASIAPLRPMAVSSIFDSLGAAGPPAAEEPPPIDDNGVPPPELSGLDMSMLGGPLPQGVPRRDVGSDAERLAAPEGDVEAAMRAEVDAPDDTASDPPPVGSAAAEDLGGMPFPDMPAAPVYSQPHDADVDLRLPPLPPYPRAPGSPLFPEPFAAAPGPQYPDPSAPFPEPIESVVSSPESAELESGRYDSYEPGAMPGFRASEAAAQPMFDAAAKIAAEASATADALHNLERLLGQDDPAVEEQARRSAYDSAPPLNLLGDPMQFTLNQRAPLMPLPVPPDAGRVKGIYLLGFLTGLGLSLMAGVALYLLITMG